MADEEENKDEEEVTDGDDAQDEAEGEEGDGKKKKKKKKGGKLKIIIIILILIVVAGGGGAAAYFMGFFEKKIEVSSGEIREGEEVVREDGIVEKTVFYDMEEFIANLNVGSKRPSFLKMTVSLELPGESQIPLVESKMP